MKLDVVKEARQILAAEAKAVRGMIPRIGKSFEKAVELMAACKGRVIMTGMGKPGFIGRKIAATLASTGTPSMYLHPAEAIHGDLGMVTSDDVILAISQSGETEEIVKIITPIKKIGAAMIAMTSNANSTLARAANVVLDLGVTKEACSLNLAPSASTTASLALGDALALCLHKKKGFKSEDFAMLHPGGSLGKRLLKVRDVMRTGKNNPLVQGTAIVREALFAITAARAGSCTVVDSKGALLGIFTDGDLRRYLRTEGQEILDLPVRKFSTQNPIVIHQDKLAAEAVPVMKSKRIDEIPVVNDKKRVVGLLDIQDLLKAGLI